MHSLVVKFYLFLLLVLLTISPISFAKNNRPSSMRSSIEQNIRTYGNTINIGIMVQSMRTGKILYHRNADRLYTPASNLKLFTEIASLSYLKPPFRFKTQLFTDQNLQAQSTLPGNVYLKFTGDPTLTSGDLNDLVATLKQRGIKRIQGNVYLDRTHYSNKSYGPGWMWDELNLCYAAPLSATIINHNCFTVWLSPGKQVGQLSQLYANKPHPFTEVVNHVATAKTDATCSLKLDVSKNNIYQLAGCLPINDKAKELSFAIYNLPIYIKHWVAYLFLQNGIQLAGNIEFAKTPDSAYLINTHTSENLDIIVNKMTKDSDNLIAESLFKQLGYQYNREQATWKNSATALKAILQNKTKVNLKKAVIVDGGGLSRYNLVTPKQLLQLLNYAYHDFKIAPEFLSSLPIGGIDGTLEKRLQDKTVKGKVRAKTGSMTGVSSLSGFIQTKTKGIVAFVILINGFSGKKKDIIPLEDKICESVARS